MSFIKKSILLFFLIGIYACNSNRTLPYIGEKEVSGSGDTIYHSISEFKFTNQDGELITEEFVKDKVYIADFFFTSCPTICPVMKTQMLRIHEKYKDNENLKILSHTIDPRHDSLSVLKNYRSKLGITGSQWQFLTAEQSYIYDIAQKKYLVSALEDANAIEEGGFIHSGAFVLVDQNRNIRGVYDGTKELEVNKLIKDIELLIKK